MNERTKRQMSPNLFRAVEKLMEKLAQPRLHKSEKGPEQVHEELS